MSWSNSWTHVWSVCAVLYHVELKWTCHLQLEHLARDCRAESRQHRLWKQSQWRGSRGGGWPSRRGGAVRGRAHQGQQRSSRVVLICFWWRLSIWQNHLWRRIKMKNSIESMGNRMLMCVDFTCAMSRRVSNSVSLWALIICVSLSSLPLCSCKKTKEPQTPGGGRLMQMCLYDRSLTSSFLVNVAISLSRSSIRPFSLSPSLAVSENLKVDTITVIKSLILQ